MNAILISAGRNPTGPTARAVEAVLDGIRAGGGRGELVPLAGLRIDRCRRCEEGRQPCLIEGRCALDDDFETVAEKLRVADAAVFASPVYLAGPAPSLRALLHRMERTGRHAAGRAGIAATPAMVLCVGGGADHCAQRLQAMLEACGFDVAQSVTGSRRTVHLGLERFNQAGKRLAARAIGRRAAGGGETIGSPTRPGTGEAPARPPRP